MNLYILDRNHVPVQIGNDQSDINHYLQWMSESDNIIVRRDSIGLVHVSTVFLGMDHEWRQDHQHQPVLFETMVFDSKAFKGKQQRCCTWDQALTQHGQVLASVLRSHLAECRAKKRKKG